MTCLQIDLPLSLAPLPVRLTTEQRAAQFDAEHPEVMDALHKLAIEQIAGGAKRLSILELYAIVRHRLKLRMNNSFMPWYARELESRFPWLRGYMEKRPTKAERATP